MTTTVAGDDLRPTSAVRKPLFDYLPVSLFGSVMGLMGLSVGWRLAGARYGLPSVIAEMIGWTAVAVFVALTVAYGAKVVTARSAALAEFRNPVAGNLFGTVLISLLLPFVLQSLSPPLAAAVWILGAAGMVVFAVLIVSRWMGSRHQLAHATPAWIVPVVGLLDVPLAGPMLGLPHTQTVMMFSLSVGLFFAVPLFTLVFARLVFEEPLAPAQRPTLMILVAPFAVGFSSYVATFGRIDAVAEALFLIALFVFAVLVGRLRDLPHCCPFRVSWWAVSFPVAAMAVAALRYAAYVQAIAADILAVLLLALATVTIAGLALRTLIGIARSELRLLAS